MGYVLSLVATVVLILTMPLAAAEQINVLCPRAVQGAVSDVAALFTRETGTEVKLTFAAATEMRTKATTDEVGDVIIASVTTVDELARSRVVIPGTLSDVGSVGVGVAVRAGARVPNVSTRESLTLAVLSASTLGYADASRGGEGGMHFANVLARLGIGASVETKTRRFPDGVTALQKVATGEIEMAFSPINEILSVPGLALAGPLPEALQARIAYSAGVLRKGHSEATARMFVEYLTLAPARARFRAGGFETPND